MEFSTRKCCEIVNAPSVDSFRNRLDKQRNNEEIVYDYKATAPAGRTIYAPAGTQDLTIDLHTRSDHRSAHKIRPTGTQDLTGWHTRSDRLAHKIWPAVMEIPK